MQYLPLKNYKTNHRDMICKIFSWISKQCRVNFSKLFDHAMFFKNNLTCPV